MAEPLNVVDPLLEWFDRPRTAANLRQPDGRALFAYRLAEADFRALQAGLQDLIARTRDLDALSADHWQFPRCFVLYAAEWWRRRYDGGQLAWARILADLDADRLAWSSVRRGACIDRGLRQWRLPQSSAGGLRYLRAIALQGGLPVALLAAARGSLGGLLTRVLRLALGTLEPSPALLRGWVGSLGDKLPHLYRQEEIYDLLTGVVAAVLALRRELGADANGDILQRLAQTCPNWRERFPLPIEDTNAQALLEQLIRVPVPVVPEDFRCERWLEQAPEGSWRLRATLEFPEQLPTGALRTRFGIDEQEPIPRTFELLLSANRETLQWPARRLAGHDQYRMERRGAALTDEAAAESLQLALIAADGRRWPAVPKRGEALDPALPWIFEVLASGQLDGTIRWVRQGGGGVRGLEIMVAVPDRWQVTAPDGVTLVCIGDLAAPGRKLYRCTGPVEIRGPEGARWRLRTGQATAPEPDYHWDGDRCWEAFISPALAYRGAVPSLYDGMNRVPSNVLTWQPGATTHGPVTVTVREQGEMVHRASLVLLPQSARIRLEPQDIHRGAIRFEAFGAATVSLPDLAEMEPSIETNGPTLTLHLRHRPATACAPAPEWIELDLLWPNNPSRARLRVPFPARGARAFDGCDRLLGPDAWVPLHRLHGVRFVAIGYQQLALALRLRHTETTGPAPAAWLPLRQTAGAGRLEVRLSDFHEDLERLLAADPLLDAWVEVALWAGPDEIYKLRVSRYLCPLERGDGVVTLAAAGIAQLDAESLASLDALALRLDAPAEEPERLTQRLSAGSPTGAWFFETGGREPGAWLIYPPTGVGDRFRPTLWTIPGGTQPNSPLATVLVIEDQDQRAAALDQVVAALAADFTEPCWSDLEQLAGQLGHLPLGTLDLWRRLAASPDAMAALALRLHTDIDATFIDRFSEELPFAWELIPFQTWHTAAERLHRQCTAWFPHGNDWRREQQCRLDTLVDSFGQRHGALTKLLGVLRCVALARDCPEVNAIRSPGADQWFSDQLFSGVDSALNRLRTAHAQDDDEAWPTDAWIARRIRDCASQQQPGCALLASGYLQDRVHNTVMNLPLLLAAEVATGRSVDWFKQPTHIHQLRCHRAFDPDWFDTAFDYTFARCLATGLLTLDL